MNPYEIKDYCRANFNAYLRKAFQHIPHSADHHILDIGCGTGVSVIEIAKFFTGRITALDSNKDCLELLQKKIQNAKYPVIISLVHGSIETAQLPARNFHIILAEGIFNIIGFKKGLLRSSGLLTHNGHMIIHDELKDREMKLQIFEENNFEVVANFVLDEKIWWEKYYRCVEKKLEIMARSLPQGTNMGKMFRSEKSEIRMYKEEPLQFRSIYYVIQKV